MSIATAQVQSQVSVGEFAAELEFLKKLPRYLASTHSLGLSLIPNMDGFIEANCGAALLPSTHADFVMVGDYVDGYREFQLAEFVTLTRRGNTLHLEMTSSARPMPILNKTLNLKNQYRLMQTFKSMVSAGVCYREAWRPFVRKNTPKGLFFGEAYHEGDASKMTARDGFPEVYVSTQREISAIEMLGQMELLEKHTGKYLLPPVATKSFIDSLIAGLPVRAPIAGRFLGKVKNPSGVSRPNKHMDYYGVEAADSKIHYVAVLKTFATTIRRDDFVVGGSQLGFNVPKMSDRWLNFVCPYTKFNQLLSEGFSEAERGLLVVAWLESQALHLQGETLWPYSIVATGLTHPQYEHNKIAEVYFDMRDNFAFWNDKAEMLCFPSLAKQFADNLTHDVRSIQVKYATH